jgi:hypothetical protein
MHCLGSFAQRTVCTVQGWMYCTVLALRAAYTDQEWISLHKQQLVLLRDGFLQREQLAPLGLICTESSLHCLGLVAQKAACTVLFRGGQSSTESSLYCSGLDILAHRAACTVQGWIFLLLHKEQLALLWFICTESSLYCTVQGWP